MELGNSQIRDWAIAQVIRSSHGMDRLDRMVTEANKASESPGSKQKQKEDSQINQHLCMLLIYVMCINYEYSIL